VKIAVPTNDGINISAHFGRCREFLIFEAQNGQVKLIETRINGGCHEHGSGSSDGAAGNHSHSGFVDALRDCETVLCSGIGAGAVEALKAGGIPVVLVQAAGSAEQIVTAFQSGALRPASGGMCQCQH
jgi:predicted Fe-Mo cluster-binding NifX family protein